MSRDRFGHCDIQLRRRHGHDCHLKFRERVFERAAHDQLTKMRQSTPYVWVHPDEGSRRLAPANPPMANVQQS
jgi:hypothetical protein